jgi:sugar lactone lactonase YvrE
MAELSSAAVDYRPLLRIGGRGNEAHQFTEAIRGIAVDGDDALYVAGDSLVKRFSPEGGLLGQWATSRPAFCVAVDSADRVWVGQWQQVEIFDGEGSLVDVWRDADALGLITAIDFAGEHVLLADASKRWIHRYDREGRLVNEIGDRHRKGGFHIPNGVVDFVVDSGGVVVVANPGMHRVERYRPDGEPLGHFGRFDGRDPAGFPGCCNPTNVAVDRRGRVIVSEKAGPRAKIYTSEGELLGVVADTIFDSTAKNMDLAVDSFGRIYVADTAALEVLVFGPVSGETAG